MISGAHTYSGDTTINRGTLVMGAGGALPSGAGKGNLNIAGSNAALDINGNALNVNGFNGNGTLTNSAAGNKSVTVGNNNASGSFNGVIAGNINLIKSGNGTQVLANNNTYLGTTTINGGTLQVGIGGVPSSFGPGDGNLRGMLGAGNVINNATLVFNRGYYTTVTNAISGTGTLRQAADAELLVGGANTYTGPTIIGQGIANIGLGGPTDGTGLAYSGDCSLNATVLTNGSIASSIGASSNAASNLVLDGGTLFYSPTSSATTDRLFTVTQNGGAIYTSGALTFSNSGAIVMSGTGDRSLSLGGDSTSASNWNCDVGDPAAGGKTTLVKDRGALWQINSSASLTYSGDTFLRMGTLRMGPGAALPFGAGKGNVVWDTSTDFNSDFPAILELNGNNLSVNALIGGVPGSTYSRVDNAGTARTLTIGNGGASGTFDGQITGAITLVKSGSGTQILTGTNTYTGGTTVNGGVLQFSGASAIGGSGANVQINNGGVLGVGSILNQAFLARINPASVGVLALTADDSAALDFGAASLSSLSLGAIGSINFSGTLSPAGSTYQLGGGGGTLDVNSPLTGAANNLSIDGGAPVFLNATNTYGGSTTVNARHSEVRVHQRHRRIGREHSGE